MSETMKALCLLDQGKIKLQDIEKPKLLKPTDVIGQVLRATICGSDTHIIDGHLPASISAALAKPGRGIALGHEGVIKVAEIGSEVHNFKVGDVCVASLITSCGKCYYCKKNLQSHCNSNDGCSALLGIETDGFQSEYIRIPLADTSLYHAPGNISLDVLVMLSDIFPTSYELAVKDKVQEGDSVAIIGLGPVGLATLLLLAPFKPSQIIAIDFNDKRLEKAKQLGATHTFNPQKDKDTVQKVLQLSTFGDRKPGVDLAIECVGADRAFGTCQSIIGPGGKICNIGIHGGPATINLQDLWVQNIGIFTGAVCANSTQELIDRVSKGELDPSPLISHHFKLSEIGEAYDVFTRANETGCIKVAITPDSVDI